MRVPSSAAGRERPVVAHVNYLFFHSTQSFIYFYLSHFRRVRPICLTRAPESSVVASTLPPDLAGDIYLYGRGRANLLDAIFRSCGLTLRRWLTRLPSGLADVLLAQLSQRIVPLVRSDADPAHFLGWTADILRRRQAQIIHAYFGPIGWRLLPLKRALGLPLVVTFLGDDIGPSVGPWWSWWIQTDRKAPDWPARLRELVAEADLLLVEGPYVRERLLAIGCPPEKLYVQRIALPLSRIPFPRETPETNGRVIILFAGRFCEQKGLLYALEAVSEIWKERRDIEFRLIGDDTMTDGRYAAQVRAFIRRHGLQACVSSLGFLNHHDYMRELRSADIFLHPSLVDAAGTGEGGAPTTILEAQALGVPVVSTYHCDIPNVTLPGESALLVAERDSRALADAIRTLLDDPLRRQSMGRAGRQHMERFHDIEREASVLEDRYFALLAGQRPGQLENRQPEP